MSRAQTPNAMRVSARRQYPQADREDKENVLKVNANAPELSPMVEKKKAQVFRHDLRIKESNFQTIVHFVLECWYNQASASSKQHEEIHLRISLLEEQKRQLAVW